MKTFYIIEKGQKLVNISGVVYACGVEFDVWGRSVMGNKMRAFNRETKKEAVEAAKEYGMVVETKVMTEEEFEAIREY